MENVSKKECIDAIEYLFVEGFVDEMKSDQKYYTKILLNKVSKMYKIELVWKD